MLSAETERILATPYARLDELLQEAPPEDAYEVIQELNEIAQRAALVSEYLTQRLGSGWGILPHEIAMKASIERYRAVRKAMGYSYPNAGLSSF